MIIWFHNTAPNLNSKIKNEVIEYVLEQSVIIDTPLEQSNYDNQTTALRSSVVVDTTPILLSAAQPKNLCAYPIQVEELFPYWLRNSSESGMTKSNLILMTKDYYDWLSCGMTGNEISFLNLETMIDIQKVPDNFLKNYMFSYVNSLPENAIRTENNNTGLIQPNSARQLFDNIKVNLYTKKGTEESFKFVLESLFGITSSDISISYPKRFVMRLNGGRYEWMRDDSTYSTPYSLNPAAYNPQLTGSVLNQSVLQDTGLWQEFSYVLNVSNLTSKTYSEIVRPLVHVAGTKDFYDTRKDIFNAITDNTTPPTGVEIPIIGNYAFYNLFYSQDLEGCCGCLGISGGTDPFPSHKFPTWDVEISEYPAGTTFGLININDFLQLYPADSMTFPNESITCTDC